MAPPSEKLLDKLSELYELANTTSTWTSTEIPAKKRRLFRVSLKILDYFEQDKSRTTNDLGPTYTKWLNEDLLNIENADSIDLKTFKDFGFRTKPPLLVQYPVGANQDSQAPNGTTDNKGKKPGHVKEEPAARTSSTSRKRPEPEVNADDDPEIAQSKPSKKAKPDPRTSVAREKAKKSTPADSTSTKKPPVKPQTTWERENGLDVGTSKVQSVQPEGKATIQHVLSPTSSSPGDGVDPQRPRPKAGCPDDKPDLGRRIPRPHPSHLPTDLPGEVVKLTRLSLQQSEKLNEVGSQHRALMDYYKEDRVRYLSLNEQLRRELADSREVIKSQTGLVQSLNSQIAKLERRISQMEEKFAPMEQEVNRLTAFNHSLTNIPIPFENDFNDFNQNPPNQNNFNPPNQNNFNPPNQNNFNPSTANGGQFGGSSVPNGPNGYPPTNLQPNPDTNCGVPNNFTGNQDTSSTHSLPILPQISQ